MKSEREREEREEREGGEEKLTEKVIKVSIIFNNQFYHFIKFYLGSRLIRPYKMFFIVHKIIDFNHHYNFNFKKTIRF